MRFNNKPNTDYPHIENKIKYLPQNPFIPSRTTLHKTFKLYGVNYDELVRFSVKFHQFQHRVFGELSGGEARLVELFLVLNAESDFCIFDEPFSNIAPVYVERIQEMIQEKKHHKGIIISDHLYEEIIEITDELFVLHDEYTFPIKGKEDLIKHGYILVIVRSTCRCARRS